MNLKWRRCSPLQFRKCAVFTSGRTKFRMTTACQKLSFKNSMPLRHDMSLYWNTRMHCSRMLTGRSLTVCCSLLRGGGGVPGRGMCLVWGVSAPGGVCLVRGVPPRGRGVCLVRGVCLRGGQCAWSGGSASGGCLLPGGYPSMHWGRHPSPPVDRQTLVKILPWPNFVAAGNKQDTWRNASSTQTAGAWRSLHASL